MYTHPVNSKYKIAFTLILLFSVFILPLSGQNIDLDQVDASENLRLGISSFHSGEFNKAILSLEKALTYKPDWEITRVFLGNAYYKAGFTDEALSYWQDMLSSGGGSTILKVRVDNIRYRRNMGPLLKDNFRYVTYHEIDGVTDNYTLFTRPGSPAPARDGGLYITSFAGNRVLKFSANGKRTGVILGGINGIDHPFDIINTGEYLFFSEYGGDRITRTNTDGGKLIRFGSTGSGDGEFLGPQFIAADEFGYIYVTDEGNKRVSKYTKDGDFLFSFGNKSASFEGFSEPTGIAYKNGNILVADKRRARLFLFDKSGNFLRSFSSSLLSSPEGITAIPDGRFLIADAQRVLIFDMDSETVTKVADVSGKEALIIKAVLDANGNIVVTDFNRNKIEYLADITRMYTGLDVSIDRVVSDNYPRVDVALSVSALDGKPLVGLEDNNFLVTENGYPVQNSRLIYSGNKSAVTNVALVLEGSEKMYGKKEYRLSALEELLSAQDGKGTISIVSAEQNPVTETKSVSNKDILVKSVIEDGDYSRDWTFDLGIRLGASTLLNKSDRRAVVFLSMGDLPDSSFVRYTLNEILDYLTNNNIAFYAIYAGEKDSAPRELEYLARKTGGGVYSLFRAEGVGGIIEDLKNRFVGSYVLEYSTSLDSDFGRKPLPVEVQVSLFGRSGRGESVYYAPLK